MQRVKRLGGKRDVRMKASSATSLRKKKMLKRTKQKETGKKKGRNMTRNLAGSTVGATIVHVPFKLLAIVRRRSWVTRRSCRKEGIGRIRPDKTANLKLRPGT